MSDRDREGCLRRGKDCKTVHVRDLIDQFHGVRYDGGRRESSAGFHEGWGCLLKCHDAPPIRSCILWSSTVLYSTPGVISTSVIEIFISFSLLFYTSFLNSHTY